LAAHGEGKKVSTIPSSRKNTISITSECINKRNKKPLGLIVSPLHWSGFYKEGFFMDEQSDIIFHEEQKFARWIYLLVLLMVVFSVIIIIVVHITESAKGNPPDKNEFITVFLFGIGVPAAIAVLFTVLKLETQVRIDGLYVRFFPIHISFKRFSPEDLSEAYARQYKPISEYGGWGIRGYGKNKAYNTRGNEGVQLVFNNGKRLLIGSQNAQELEEAIQSIMG
jgi:hypothetical protein